MPADHFLPSGIKVDSSNSLNTKSNSSYFGLTVHVWSTSMNVSVYLSLHSRVSETTVRNFGSVVLMMLCASSPFLWLTSCFLTFFVICHIQSQWYLGNLIFYMICLSSLSCQVTALCFRHGYWLGLFWGIACSLWHVLSKSTGIGF